MNVDYVLNDNVNNLSTLSGKNIGELNEELLYENMEDVRLKFCFGIFQNQFNIPFSFMNEKKHILIITSMQQRVGVQYH